MVTSFYSAGGDGRAYNNTSSDWATKRSATNADAVSYPDSSTNCPITQDGATGLLARYFLPIDTTTLPANAVISAATLYVYVNSVTNPDASSLSVSGSTQASPTELVAGDYSKITVNSPTEFATRINYASLSTSAYNAFAFNAAGLAAISKGGYTKLVLRDGKNDVDGNTPTNNGFININGSGAAGTNTDPYLEITYTVPATTVSGSFYFM